MPTNYLSDNITMHLIAACAVGVEEDFVISGGISKNIGVVRRVEQKLGTTSHICFEPQVVGALGAALFARDFLGRTASKGP